MNQADFIMWWLEDANVWIINRIIKENVKLAFKIFYGIQSKKGVITVLLKENLISIQTDVNALIFKKIIKGFVKFAWMVSYGTLQQKHVLHVQAPKRFIIFKLQDANA